MPELPDVETFRRYFEKTALDRTISKVEVPAEEILEDITAGELAPRLEKNRFVETFRHGKYAFARVSDDGWTVFHFGMTGYFYFAEAGEEPPRHTRVLFRFDDGTALAYVSQRKLGFVSMTESPAGFVEKHGLGPDALDDSVDAGFLKGMLGKTGTAVKSALMDQSRMAGIGNDYSDEILFQARTDPRKPANEINDDGIQKIHDAMKSVLKQAVEAGADPDKMPENYLLPHRRKGETCPVCGGETASIKIGGRTSYFCPSCQK